MLTHVCEDICKTTNRTLWTLKQCRGLKLQPKEVFYPVSWSDFLMYFDPNKLNETLQMTQNSTTIHVWNDLSHGIWNKKDIKNAYQAIAEQKCPSVYNASEYF